jgi:hypothetical protein
MQQDSATPNEPRLLKAPRTLVIGLGGVGGWICGRIMEEITAEFGDDGVPWVRFLILDTDIHRDLPATLQSQFIHLTLSLDQISHLRTSPHAFDASIGYTAWAYPELLSDSLEHGTRGIRFLGRLALLSSPNCGHVMVTIERELREQTGRFRHRAFKGKHVSDHDRSADGDT